MLHKDTYGSHEEGNTLNYAEFQDYLDANKSNIDIATDLVPQMKDIVIDTFLATKKIMNPVAGQRANGFELFGYDFMIDEDFRVWLIEVNTCPYLG